MYSRKSKTSKRQNSQINPNSFCIFEQLEGRQLYSASIIQAATPTTPVLTINAGTASQVLILNQSSTGITLTDNGKSTLTKGNFSSIVINANSGNDSVVIAKTVTDKVTVNGGTGIDLLSTGASNDTINAGTGATDVIALGGKNNRLVAGKGYDNIWYTAGNTVVKGAGTLVAHAIGSFINTTDMSLDGKNISEPLTNTQVQDTGGWVNVSALGCPLFNPGSYDMYGQVVKGPTILDINQGEAGTCYFLSSLGSIAMQDPQHIENLIAPLGDGTYVEQFVGTNGKVSFVRVDGNLPVSANSIINGQPQLEYEKLGLGDSTWAPLMEKGWAYMRAYEHGQAASYGFAEGGTGEEALNALGGTSILYQNGSMSSVFSNGNTMLEWISQQLEDGKAVDLGFTNEVAGQLCSGHEYSAVSVVFNSNGTIAGMWVHNPWGVDTEQQTIASAGHNDGYNDGFVFISAATAFSDCCDLASAVV